jgi:hypothetical protein
MRRSGELLVLTEMVAVIVTMAFVGLFGMARAQAASPVVRIRADATLQKPHGSDVSASVLNVATTFSTDTPAAQLFTVQKAVLYFPDRGTDGRPFPSCDARQIERFHGNVRRCPKGSKIGSGTVKARVLQLGVTATGTVTMFNSRHGKSITFNIRAIHPAAINRSFDGQLTPLRGRRYRRKLTLEVPPTLQEVLPGTFVAVQEFDVTIDGAVRVHGVQHNYVEARTCPKWPMRGTFDLTDSTTGHPASVTTDAELRCKVS